MIRAFLLVVLVTIFSCSDKKGGWLLVYYMPYDNNLSYLADTVIQQLQSISNPGLTIALQADLKGDEGMIRYRIKNGQMETEKVDSDDSNSLNAISDYLRWIRHLGEYRKVALIFLDHGGKLDEVGLDENSTLGSRFLNLFDIKTAVKELNDHRKAPLDLLYFQVCTKSNIEVLYEVKELAMYTLASQNELGAPNYYYPSLNQLSPDHSGAELAELIVTNETRDMYYSQTLIDNSGWKSILEKGNQEPRVSPSVSRLKFLRYWDSNYVDLLSFFSALGYDSVQMNEFSTAMHQLVHWHKINPENSRMEGFSGIGMLSPWDKGFDQYVETFAIYREWDIKGKAEGMR